MTHKSLNSVILLAKERCFNHLSQEWSKTCFFHRHILASLHFNENLKRETHKASDGSDYIKVTYPKFKFKLGEEVVRGVALLPTYSKN